jgi:hypothetical protein
MNGYATKPQSQANNEKGLQGLHFTQFTLENYVQTLIGRSASGLHSLHKNQATMQTSYKPGLHASNRLATTGKTPVGTCKHADLAGHLPM